MKKRLLFCFILSLFLWMPTVLASTNTFTRTEEDYLVPSDVSVTEGNKQDILKTPAIDASEKIYDFADLYTVVEEEELYDKVKEFIDKSQYDLILVTTTDLNGYIIGDYTNNFYDFNDFKKDGIIFVIYLGGLDPQIYMGTNGGPASEVFTIYTDARVKDTLSYVYKDIKNKNYYLATENFIKIVDGFFQIDKEKKYVIDQNGNVVKDIPWIELVILASALSFIIVFSLIKGLKKYNKVEYSDNLDSKLNPGTMNVSIAKDEFIDRVLGKAK